MTFEQIKIQLETLLVDELHHVTGKFEVVNNVKWFGDCPTPQPRIKANNLHTHREDESLVCFDCLRIHVLESDYDTITPQVVKNMVNFISQEHRKLFPPEDKRV